MLRQPTMTRRRCLAFGAGAGAALLAGGTVEVTTLRHDVSTDGRRATVTFADDWQDDDWQGEQALG